MEWQRRNAKIKDHRGDVLAFRVSSAVFARSCSGSSWSRFEVNWKSMSLSLPALESAVFVNSSNIGSDSEGGTVLNDENSTTAPLRV